MTFLVDANVLSEPTKAAPDQRCLQWLKRHEREIAVDPIILAEIRFGILLLAKGRRRRKLEQWFDVGVQLCNASRGRLKQAFAGQRSSQPFANPDARCRSRTV